MAGKAWIVGLGLAACLALSACVLPGSKAAEPPAAVAEAGPDDPRPKARPGSETAPNPDGASSPSANAALEPPAAARTPDADDDLLPQAAETEATPEDETPAPTLPDKIFQAPEPPPVPAALTGQAAQCTKAKGNFVRRGEGGTFVCVKPTRDANKRCDDSSDCDGLCFAKSRTCAPVSPLFGCYDALENGRVVNICTE